VRTYWDDGENYVVMASEPASNQVCRDGTEYIARGKYDSIPTNFV
jgi:hypothetical protein